MPDSDSYSHDIWDSFLSFSKFNFNLSTCFSILLKMVTFAEVSFTYSCKFKNHSSVWKLLTAVHGICISSRVAIYHSQKAPAVFINVSFQTGIWFWPFKPMSTFCLIFCDSISLCERWLVNTYVGPVKISKITQSVKNNIYFRDRLSHYLQHLFNLHFQVTSM